MMAKGWSYDKRNNFLNRQDAENAKKSLQGLFTRDCRTQVSRFATHKAQKEEMDTFDLVLQII
jgi:hypothetical protein